MCKKNILAVTAFFFFLVITLFTVEAQQSPPPCAHLHEKASGDMAKYSLDADVNGLQFFSGIRCALRYRNTELCAIEMVSFDITGKVYDYYTGAKIDIGRAYFWFDEADPDGPVLAFRSRESADKYGEEKGRGMILDYAGLTDLNLK